MNASHHVTILIKLKLTDMYLLIFETFYSIFENNTVQIIFLNEMAYSFSIGTNIFYSWQSLLLIMKQNIYIQAKTVGLINNSILLFPTWAG